MTESSAQAIQDKIPDVVITDSHGQTVICVPKDSWHEVIQMLKEDHGYVMCLDLTAVDFLGANERSTPTEIEQTRFELVANLIRHRPLERMRLICEVGDADPSVDSIIDIFPGMAMAEREVFDLMGVTFEGHENLCRLLMPEDWDGYPLRKDFESIRIPVSFKHDSEGS